MEYWNKDNFFLPTGTPGSEVFIGLPLGELVFKLTIIIPIHNQFSKGPAYHNQFSKGPALISYQFFKVLINTGFMNCFLS